MLRPQEAAVYGDAAEPAQHDQGGNLEQASRVGAEETDGRGRCHQQQAVPVQVAVVYEGISLLIYRYIILYQVISCYAYHELSYDTLFQRLAFN